MKFFGRFLKAATGLMTTAGILLGSLAVPAAAEEIKLPSNEAILFVDSMGAGWNLGNAFDASDCTWLSNELDYEKAWCGAKTTENLIKEIKKAGYSTIRIPVSWHNHVDKDLNISKTWADRVQEVVDWSLDAGLKVIINSHHDVKKGYYFPTSAEYKTSEKYITKIWKQIAKRYADYDNRLIFEIINEPRVVGDKNEWWFIVDNTPDVVKDSIDCINRLNQKALDTIRATGGKNADRFVIVCGYDTSVDGVYTDGFKLPKDSAKNRLIVAVHLYERFKSSYQGLLSRVYEKFVQAGVPVIMDEFNMNSDPKKNKYDEKSVEYFGEWAKYARERGISTVIWDDNSNGYRVINRGTAEWAHKDIAKAIIKNGAPAMKVKPALTVKAGKGKATLSWTKVEGAKKYGVFQYKSGKLVKICYTKKLEYTVEKLKSGKTYKYAVCALVNGEWTEINESDIKSVKIK